MFKRFTTYFKDEDGAVTVDWVVLCAGLVAMAAAIALAMEDGTLAATADIDTFLQSRNPN
ncbi:hypothetical protein [Shimia sp.]|uniref:hypothetical protein n=1 Tax=Shimia sp. TaxID=1954381 RepID=UPI003292549C